MKLSPFYSVVAEVYYKNGEPDKPELIIFDAYGNAIKENTKLYNIVSKIFRDNYKGKCYV